MKHDIFLSKIFFSIFVVGISGTICTHQEIQINKLVPSYEELGLHIDDELHHHLRQRQDKLRKGMLHIASDSFAKRGWPHMLKAIQHVYLMFSAGQKLFLEENEVKIQRWIFFLISTYMGSFVSPG